MTAKDPAVRHPLGRSDEDVFFGSGSAGIFDVQRQNEIGQWVFGWDSAHVNRCPNLGEQLSQVSLVL